MLNILIGTWLLVSAFALGMSGVIFWVTLLLGIAVVALEAMAFWKRDIRYGTAIVGALVLLSAFVANFSPTPLVGDRDMAFWNNFFCGVLLVVLSLAFRSRVRLHRWMPDADHRRVRV